MKKVRVRFAPSPTGPLHIGGIRTALFNYMFAKKYDGDLILRIEDTDSTRFVDWSEKYITDSFDWLNIKFDESPSNPNVKYGNYRQSERLYEEYVEKLVLSDNAYCAFDTKEELDDIKEIYKKSGSNFTYNHQTRMQMKNSLSLSASMTEELINKGVPYVIRFKVPKDRTIIINDLIRGKISFESKDLDDKVIFKSDKIPTYHLANVVDDHLMEISHVIRGEEWLSSCPIHTLIYEALGWEMPIFAHLPLIMNPKGNGKVSKRNALLNGFSVYPMTVEYDDEGTKQTMLGYKEMGYEPEALINFLALLGWAPKDNKEIMSLDEMIKEFDLDKVSKAGAKFDIDKLKWINSQYVNLINNSELIPIKGKYSELIENLICSLAKERAFFRTDLEPIINIFYSDVNSYSDDISVYFKSAFADFNCLDYTDPILIKEYIHDLALKQNIKLGKILPSLRHALTGLKSGPDLMNIMYILGKTETELRIKKALK